MSLPIIKHIVTIRDARALGLVFSDTFETSLHVSDDYLSKALADPNVVLLGAVDDDQIVGGLAAFTMHPLHGAKEMYLYDIAVMPSYQRRGIGTLLFEELKRIAKSAGVVTIFVESEQDDDVAASFYVSLGGVHEGVRHFNISV